MAAGKAVLDRVEAREPMKVATWNVNSLRVRLEQVLDWLARVRPDVLCLQEIKVTNEHFPAAAFADLGYQAVVSGEKAYNGVAIVSPHRLTGTREGFPDYDAGGQKRLIAATLGSVRLVNAYVPNGSEPGSAKFAAKLEFLAQLRRYLDRLHSPEERLILAGDFNIAPAADDVYDPEAMEGQIGFHPAERTGLEGIRSWGLVDMFRRHHQEPGHSSWWDYRAGAFRRNLGLRIDHIWTTASLAALGTECAMDREMRTLSRPSDHIPVWAAFDWTPGE